MNNKLRLIVYLCLGITCMCILMPINVLGSNRNVVIGKFSGDIPVDKINYLQGVFEKKMQNIHQGKQNFRIINSDMNILKDEQEIQNYKYDQKSHKRDKNLSYAATFRIEGNIVKKDNNSFRIYTKIIEVATGEIIDIYSQDFNNINDIDKLKNDLETLCRNTYDKVEQILSRRYFIKTSVKFLFPNKVFRNISDYGFGVTLSLNINNIFLKNLTLGIESGYYSFIPTRSDIVSISFIPVYLNISYNFNVYSNFYVSPIISSGIGIVRCDVENSNWHCPEKPDTQLSL